MDEPSNFYVIALGSNLGDRTSHVEAAIAHMSRLVSVQARSPLYETAPVGAADQPFLNAAILIETPQPPETLIETLLNIETAMGRVRLERWGNRLIDLDILLWKPVSDDKKTLTRSYRSTKLCIPHPELLGRNFALVPASDVAPDWRHPITKQSLTTEVHQRAYKLEVASNGKKSGQVKEAFL